jgi:hypothetical protein
MCEGSIDIVGKYTCIAGCSTTKHFIEMCKNNKWNIQTLKFTVSKYLL